MRCGFNTRGRWVALFGLVLALGGCLVVGCRAFRVFGIELTASVHPGELPIDDAQEREGG